MLGTVVCNGEGQPEQQQGLVAAMVAAAGVDRVQGVRVVWCVTPGDV